MQQEDGTVCKYPTPKSPLCQHHSWSKVKIVADGMIWAVLACLVVLGLFWPLLQRRF